MKVQLSLYHRTTVRGIIPKSKYFFCLNNDCMDTKALNTYIIKQWSVQFSSVAQSCPTLCEPMNCSVPGLPVHHQLPEFTQTYVHPAISSSVVPFSSCPKYLPASGSFPMSQLFTCIARCQTLRIVTGKKTNKQTNKKKTVTCKL